MRFLIAFIIILFAHDTNVVWLTFALFLCL